MQDTEDRANLGLGLHKLMRRQMEIKSHFWKGKKMLLSASLGQLNKNQTLRETRELSMLRVFFFLPNRSVGEAQGKGPEKSNDTKAEASLWVCDSS